MEQNLSQYKIFYEVAKAGNISKAAKELYISQPAISKSISKLEESLDITLFHRNSRGVQLTEEGLLLFDYAKTAFEALSAGEQELKRIKNFQIGHLRIGVSNTLCRFVMVSYLKGFIAKYPHVKVTIESQSSSHTLTMIEQDRIDIGLVAEPKSRKPLAFLPVSNIHDIFVASPAYLENLYLREGKDADIFQVGNLMLLDETNVTRRHVDDYMNFYQLEPTNVLETTTMDLLIEFARIGMGIACVIQEFVAEDLKNGTLIQVTPGNPIHQRTIGFSYSENRSSMALKAFLDYYKNY